MDSLIVDILRLIFDQLNFISQLELRLVSTYFMTNCPIRRFLNSTPNQWALTNDYLKSYPNLTELDVNANMTDINHLTNLRRLSINRYCMIANDGFSQLTNLTELSVCNGYVLHINHMTSLRKLSIGSAFVITNDGLTNLTNLTELYTHNKAITDINHMAKLQILHTDPTMSKYECCGITNEGISKLTSLTKLYMRNTNNITDINHMIKVYEN